MARKAPTEASINRMQTMFTESARSFWVTPCPTGETAAVKFAQTEGIKGVTGMGGLLGRIAERSGYATVTDDRGDVVGRIDPNNGSVTIYPQGR